MTDETEPDQKPVEPTVVVAEPVADDPGAPTVPAEAYSETELLEAVGASRRPSASRNRRPENLDEAAPPAPVSSRRRPPTAELEAESDVELDPAARAGRNRLWMVLAVTALVGGTITAFVLLGSANTDRYEIVCTADKIIPEQGRAFPPWGVRPMSGPAWKPIEIPPNAECEHIEPASETALGAAFEAMLVKRAHTLLTGDVTKVDLAEQQLNQALLLVRAPTQATQRNAIEHLLGDVGYWRADAKLREAKTALTDAAKLFDAAAARTPEIKKNAGAWSAYIQKVVAELQLDPEAAAHPPAPTVVERPDRPAAPLGSAQPIDNSKTATHSEPAPSAPPDAGVPTGGVLL